MTCNLSLNVKYTGVIFEQNRHKMSECSAAYLKFKQKRLLFLENSKKYIYDSFNNYVDKIW